MHSKLFCELVLKFSLRPSGPLLIKSGDEDPLDPTLPKMQFIRTYAPSGEFSTIFIPGASLKGVVRAHAERLVRSQNPLAACDPLRKKEEVPPGFRASCSLHKNQDKLSGDEAYRKVCYTCRIFGSTAVSGRILFSDLMPDRGAKLVLGERKGVAIDRITGAAAVGIGPFEMEVVYDALFQGEILLRNFTIGQLGLVAGSLLDISDGLVPIGFGKSKGFGRVTLGFDSLKLRYPKDTGGEVWGVGNIASREVLSSYGLDGIQGTDRLEAPIGESKRAGLFSVEFVGGDAIRQVFESAAPRWLDEISGWPWMGGE